MIDGTKADQGLATRMIPQIWLVKANLRKLPNVVQSTEVGRILDFGCHVQNHVGKEPKDGLDFAMIQCQLMEAFNVQEVQEIIMRKTTASPIVQLRVSGSVIMVEIAKSDPIALVFSVSVVHVSTVCFITCQWVVVFVSSQSTDDSQVIQWVGHPVGQSPSEAVIQ